MQINQRTIVFFCLCYIKKPADMGEVVNPGSCLKHYLAFVLQTVEAAWGGALAKKLSFSMKESCPSPVMTEQLSSAFKDCLTSISEAQNENTNFYLL